MIYKFYDTCSLLQNTDYMFQEENVKVAISSITLEEIENIKTSLNKDADVKYSARKALRTLEEYYGTYEIVMFDAFLQSQLEMTDMPINNDAKIIMCARHLQEKYPKDTVIFITNDLSCKHLAHLYFGNNVDSIVEEKYDYDGYKEVYLNEEEMSNFYSNMNKNLYDLHINQYLLVYNAADCECVDRLCWTGDGYRRINYDVFSSPYFGDVKPMKGDVYQALVADSFMNNKITMVKGPAGSGKTFLSLGYLLHLLSKHKIDKIIVFCNTVATKNSAKLGYYPGTRDEKLLDSQIGNLLMSKLGGRYIVEQMIQQEQLILLPMSDIRGYDTSGM